MKIYNTYPTKEQALIYKELLINNGLDCKVIVRGQSLDALFSGDDLENKYVLKLHEEDFVQARSLIIKSIDIDNVEKDYYLLHFTDEELKDVAFNALEWSEFDVALSRKILEEKGIVFEEKEMLVQSIKRTSETKMEAPKYSKTLIITGYVFAFLGGLIGVAIGYHLWKHKKTLEDGSDRFIYSENSRDHGKNMVYIGIPIWVIGFLIKYYNEILEVI